MRLLPVRFTLPRGMYVPSTTLLDIFVPAVAKWNAMRPGLFEFVDGPAEGTGVHVQYAQQTWVERPINNASATVNWRDGQPVRDAEHELCHVLGYTDLLPPGWSTQGYHFVEIYDPADPDRPRGIRNSLDVESWFSDADIAMVNEDFPLPNRVVLPEVAKE